MQNYKMEALWDCIYCGNKGLKGSAAECPNCGHRRGAEVRFYLPKDWDISHAVDETKTKVSRSPDWMCFYCRAYNSSERENCISCGAIRDKAAPDYINIQTQKHREQK